MTSTLPLVVETPSDDRLELFVGLARGEDHLGHPGPALAIGVEAGKAQVIHPRSLQPTQGVLDADLPGRYLLQYLLYLFFGQ